MTALPPPDSFELLSAYLDGELTEAERAQVDDLLSHEPRAPRRAGSGRAGPHLASSAAGCRASRWLPRTGDRRGRAAAGPGQEAQVGHAQPRRDRRGLGARARVRQPEPVARRLPRRRDAGADAHRGVGRLRRPPRIARRRPARPAGGSAGRPRRALLGAALVAGRPHACARCRSTATSSASCTATTPTS